ncbi:Protein of unknown function [Pyronema omphalodes CBS 100304]|uniref:Uncharacterized protein n=1 Tax=Pyronema omphalodes (strain CBS 100304) TaxID=1076935 RepID=U4KUW6_PYROM|nr:Protein of unknown function [Pyronema omphalodes CBS 100304]
MYDSDEDVYRFETKVDCDCPAEEYGGLSSVTLENLLDYVAQKVPYLRDGQFSLHESRFSILHPTSYYGICRASCFICHFRNFN